MPIACSAEKHLGPLCHDLAKTVKVLILHNAYRERGGEDGVAQAELALLRGGGVTADLHTLSNHDISGLGGKIATLAKTAQNRGQIATVMDIMHADPPDIVHIHNFFPLLSPAVHRAIAARDIPIVQTLHNYRLLCANGQFLRNDRICEDCLNGSRLPAIAHRCYRGSVAGTLGVLAMQNASIKTPAWINAVSQFIALTRFASEKFSQNGIPADKITVKPNFVAHSQASTGPARNRKGGLFVGRMTAAKGVRLLLDAWQTDQFGPLTLLGDGPDRAELEAQFGARGHFAGMASPAQVTKAMRCARFLVFPSIWYEGFPLTLVEALACGLPVIAPRLGGIPEIVEHGVNGLLFDAGDRSSLRQAIAHASADSFDLAGFSANARISFSDRYTPESNLEQLMGIYRACIAARAQPAASAQPAA